MASPTSAVVSVIKSCLSFFRKTVSEAKANDSLKRIISEANELPILSKSQNMFLNSKKQNNIAKKENVGFTKINQVKSLGKILKERKYESSKLQSSTLPLVTKLKNSHKKNILATDKKSLKKCTMKRNNLKKNVKKQAKLERKISVLKRSKFLSSLSGNQANDKVKETLLTNETPKKMFQRSSIKEIKDSNGRFESSSTTKDINPPSEELVEQLDNFKLHNSKSPSSTLYKEFKTPKKSVSDVMPKNIARRQFFKNLKRDASGRFISPNTTKDIISPEKKVAVQTAHIRLQNSSLSSLSRIKEIKIPEKVVLNETPKNISQRNSIKKTKDDNGRFESSSETRDIITRSKDNEVPESKKKRRL